MIFHEHKCIFIHIPKCAGSSIANFFAPNMSFDIRTPNYENLFGWCPERKLHMQHATTNQIIDTGLISKDIWDSYYKFTFVRNPWDRAYSDFIWMKKELDLKVSLKTDILRRNSFYKFINKKGVFEQRLTDNSNMAFRGDHLLKQTDFINIEGDSKMDFIGRFENFDHDINHVLKTLNINKKFETHINNSSNRHGHYSEFYNFFTKQLIAGKYKKDISLLNYTFDKK